MRIVALKPDPSPVLSLFVPRALRSRFCMTAGAHQRLDKWLWHARVVRTRTSASALVDGGLVRVNGARTTQPAHAVKTGDVLTVALDARVRVLRIEGLASRRGDATAARALYAELN